MFSPWRHLPLWQPTELGVDRLGDSNGRHHHEHHKSKPCPREAPEVIEGWLQSIPSDEAAVEALREARIPQAPVPLSKR